MFRRLLFNLWYFKRPPWDSGISPPELLDFIQNHPPGKAIDLGCGTGTNVITLARAGWRVTGVDFAFRAISAAKRKIEKAGVQADVQVGDVTRLNDVADSFDLVLDIGCFHSLPQSGRQDYLKQLDRILASNGFWLLYAFFSPDSSQTGPGLAEVDIDSISTQFKLVSRQDGFERGERPSAWFLFQK